MVEPEPMKKFSKKDQIRLDKELVIKLQAEEEEEERLAREKVEANVALIKEWNDIQAKIKDDQLLAERLQAREQEKLTIEERAKLFQQLLEKRRKHFAAKRAEKNRNRPQQKLNKEKMFDKAFKRVNIFFNFRTEIAQESNSKRVGDELEQESIKKQKVDEDTKTAKLQSLIQNLEDLYKLVKDKYGSTRLVEDLDLILYGDLKTMFDPHVEDQRYPLTPATIIDMLNKKLQADHWNEMCYQLRVADELAERDAKRSRNGDDSHDSGTGGRRQAPLTRECTYSDFLKCQPLNFKVACQTKFATCTLQGNALTWWNSHVKTVTHEVAYAMTWKTLKKMMTDKYCPRGKIKKLEIEMMFLKESNETKKYVGGLPNMIHGSVMASKPKTMQDAIEFATKLMDEKIRTITERQTENKRKLDDNSSDNNAQQPPFKRQNVARAYSARPSEKKEYVGTPIVQQMNQGHFRGVIARELKNRKPWKHNWKGYDHADAEE
ncbi:reverse transcriptase domain-containing protein [Tanacetum coccineum]|uniref:Reverse transcriptase domain-containing protein n=1 Tax=Tanacetum coccineum TaxID=301880 RepID=A0ABQ4ZYU5_9ASTR